MAAGHDRTPLARRTVLGLGTLALAALVGVTLPVSAHAGTQPAPITIDRHSRDPGKGHPSPGGTPTPEPTPTPTDHPTTPPPGSPPPYGPSPSGGVGSPVSQPVPVSSGPAVVPVPAGPAAGRSAATAPGDAQSSGDGPVLLGRQLPQSDLGDPQAHASIPAVAPVLDPSDTVWVAGTAMPLWLIVGSGGLLVVLLAVGLVLTLRDREREPDAEGLSILEAADPPASVKFG